MYYTAYLPGERSAATRAQERALFAAVYDAGAGVMASGVAFRGGLAALLAGENRGTGVGYLISAEQALPEEACLRPVHDVTAVAVVDLRSGERVTMQRTGPLWHVLDWHYHCADTDDERLAQALDLRIRAPGSILRRVHALQTTTFLLSGAWGWPIPPKS